MPQQKVNIMVWNVRDMGNYRISDEQLSGVYASCVANFIAQLIKSLSIDALVIQELKPGGVQMLEQITTILNAAGTVPPSGGAADAVGSRGADASGGEEYIADFIPSQSGERERGLDGDKIQAAMRMISVGHTEAYGLIAKQKFMKKQTSRHLLSPKEYLGLCWSSYCRVIANVKNAANAPSFGPNPKEKSTATDLDFIGMASSTIERGVQRIINRGVRKSAGGLSLEDALEVAKSCTDQVGRRPCKLIVSANNTDIHLLTYHGISARDDPSNVKAHYGASLACLIEETLNPNVILAGDFNIIDPASITREFGLITYNGYNAETELTSGVYARTQFGITEGNPLDLMFTKFAKNVSKITNAPIQESKLLVNGVLNIPKLLCPNQPLNQSTFSGDSQWWALIAAAQANLQQFPYFGQALRTDRQLVDHLRGSLNPQSALLFYYSFISDHMPLMISLNVDQEGGDG